MSNTFRILAALAGFSIATWLGACGDDECQSGATECVSDSLIRTCVPSESENQWLVSQCASNTSCLTDPSLVIRDVDAGTSPSSFEPSKQPACVGTCEVGKQECVNSQLSQVCVTGGLWQLNPCDVGQKCNTDTGACNVGDGKNVVQACKPGARACASEKVEKVCDADGTDWVEQPCPSNQTCMKDRCQPDPKSSCDDGDSCLDNKTAVRCVSNQEGYRLEKCEGELYCEKGRCRGTTCAVGTSCVGSSQVRECVGGKTYKDTQCGVNEICRESNGAAECVPLQCTEGKSRCGDPRDSSVDSKKNFSACVKNSSGVPEWVRGECTGAATCDPARGDSTNPCAQECTKGAQRCANDALGGVNDGYQTCGDDGKWGAVKSCNTGASGRLLCAMASTPNASSLPKAVCAAPICQWSMSNPNVGSTGACEGDKLRKCQDDGSLAAAASCGSGVCRTLRSTVTADGNMPGACSTTPECKPDEEVCVDAGNTVTPRYRTCVNGSWSVELKTCTGDSLCYTKKEDNGLRKALCGAQCSPGSRRCNDKGEVETCDGSGHYGAGSKCSAGVCSKLDNNDAACVLECVPGARVCAGAGMIAPDGYHAGTTQEIVCSAEGRKQAAQNCAAGSLCRVTDSGVTLGCVECIGPKAPGGNDEGTSDSRCDPGDAKKVQDCNDNNTWAAGRACSGSKLCVSPTLGTCGNCQGADSNTMIVCSNTNLMGVGSSCDNRGYGAPGSWGGVSDCCADYQMGAGTAGSFAYCK